MQLQHRDLAEFVTAVLAELEPFEWRSLTPEMLARRVLGAVDRQRVQTLLESTPGLGAADGGGGEPVSRADERVGVLVDLLSAHRWRSWTLPFLARQLTYALALWWEHRRRLEVELSRLVSGDN
jgi:hypothetical protein